MSSKTAFLGLEAYYVTFFSLTSKGPIWIFHQGIKFLNWGQRLENNNKKFLAKKANTNHTKNMLKFILFPNFNSSVQKFLYRITHSP